MPIAAERTACFALYALARQYKPKPAESIFRASFYRAVEAARRTQRHHVFGLPAPKSIWGALPPR
jgi:hypothetical protein